METKAHKIEIRQKENSGDVMTGANTEILLDGMPLKMVQGLKFEVLAGGLAKITLEMVANTALVGQIGELEQTYIPIGGSNGGN